MTRSTLVVVALLAVVPPVVPIVTSAARDVVARRDWAGRRDAVLRHCPTVPLVPLLRAATPARREELMATIDRCTVEAEALTAEAKAHGWMP